MNINFFDISDFRELHDALYVHKKVASSIEFVLSTDRMEAPHHLAKTDLLIIVVDELFLTMNDLNKLQRVNCAGVLIFAHKIRSVPSFLNCVEFNLIISTNIESMRVVMNKIMLVTSASSINKTMIRGIVDSILFKDENYALLDWLYILKLMNVNTFDSYQVALVKIDNPEKESIFYNQVITHLQSEHQMKLYSVWKNLLICILHEKQEQTAIEVLQNMHTTFSPYEQEHVKIALGSSYAGLEHIQKSFREAIRTFDMIPIINPSDHICSYKMLGIYCILYELNNPEFFDQYCSDLFTPLINFDKKTQSSLFPTLECYFVNECDLESTALQLNIHRNTLRYRIKKIEEVMSLNLQNINAITEIVTAFKIRRLNTILKE